MFIQFSLHTNCWHLQILKNINSLHIAKLQHFKHQAVRIYEGDRSRIQLLTWSTVTNSSDFGILNPFSNHSEVYIHIDDIHTNTHLPAADRWKCIAQSTLKQLPTGATLSVASGYTLIVSSWTLSWVRSTYCDVLHLYCATYIEVFIVFTTL